MRTGLKKTRQSFTIKQEQVAEHLGMEVTSYQRIEAGIRGTSEDNWIKLFELFDKKTPLQELMKNTP